MYSLYVVTDPHLSNGRSHEEIAELAYLGGADVVQLREKDMDGKELFDTAVRIKRLAREYGKMFIVNDRLDIALVADADGVHVGQSDIPVKAIRREVPADFIVGVSVQTVAQARKAEKDGADYVALSPIYDTSTKDDAGRGKGLQMLKDIVNAVSIPVLAIGGIDSSNAAEIIEAGAEGVAVVSAVVSQPDVTEAARELKAIITDARIRASSGRR